MTAAGIILVILGIMAFAASYIRDCWLVEVNDLAGMVYLVITDILLYGSSIAMIFVPIILSIVTKSIS